MQVRRLRIGGAEHDVDGVIIGQAAHQKFRQRDLDRPDLVAGQVVDGIGDRAEHSGKYVADARASGQPPQLQRQRHRQARAERLARNLHIELAEIALHGDAAGGAGRPVDDVAGSDGRLAGMVQQQRFTLHVQRQADRIAAGVILIVQLLWAGGDACESDPLWRHGGSNRTVHSTAAIEVLDVQRQPAEGLAPGIGTLMLRIGFGGEVGTVEQRRNLAWSWQPDDRSVLAGKRRTGTADKPGRRDRFDLRPNAWEQASAPRATTYSWVWSCMKRAEPPRWMRQATVRAHRYKIAQGHPL